nr:hypothetical protein [Tanacetum cinerariifolium]
HVSSAVVLNEIPNEELVWLESAKERAAAAEKLVVTAPGILVAGFTHGFTRWMETGGLME